MIEALALALAAAAPPAAAFPPPRPLVPFVYDTDVDDCVWRMHDKSEKWIRGGIGRGDEDPMIDFVDWAFHGWSDSERHAIEISVGDPARRLPATAWSTSGGGQTPGSLAFYMDAKLRQMIGGATSLQVWKGGKPVFSTLLANTPTAAQLDACVRPPSDPEHTDEE
jgi:hypothetical protein